MDRRVSASFAVVIVALAVAAGWSAAQDGERAALWRFVGHVAYELSRTKSTVVRAAAETAHGKRGCWSGEMVQILDARVGPRRDLPVAFGVVRDAARTWCRSTPWAMEMRSWPGSACGSAGCPRTSHLREPRSAVAEAVHVVGMFDTADNRLRRSLEVPEPHPQAGDLYLDGAPAPYMVTPRP